MSPTERLEQVDIEKALDHETTGRRAGRNNPVDDELDEVVS